MYEKIPLNEPANNQAIADLSVALMDRGHQPVRRGQHPKQHGCVRAQFIVAADLPPELARGIFAGGQTYPAWVRFSNGSQDDDRHGDVHGMAIKLMNVEGEKLLEDEKHEKTQDLVLMDNPAFFGSNSASNRSLAQAILNSRSPSLLKNLFFFLSEARRRMLYIVLRHFVFGLRFRELRVLRAATSKLPANPLDVTYWSATPYLLGDLAVKYKAVPQAPGGLQSGDGLTAAESDASDRLRYAMRNRLRQQEVSFDFLVQTYLDEQRTPVEDAAIAWDEMASPFRKVARVVIPPQGFDTEEQMRFGENLSFTPWHSLPVHRPLGGVNRARKVVYLASSQLRHQLNGASRREPDASGVAAPGTADGAGRGP